MAITEHSLEQATQPIILESVNQFQADDSAAGNTNHDLVLATQVLPAPQAAVSAPELTIVRAEYNVIPAAHRLPAEAWAGIGDENVETDPSKIFSKEERDEIAAGVEHINYVETHAKLGHAIIQMQNAAAQERVRRDSLLQALGNPDLDFDRAMDDQAEADDARDRVLYP